MENILGQTGRVTLQKKPAEINPLLLAYLGDAVYELFVRYHLLARGESRPNAIHQEAVRFVSARAQAEVVRRVELWLTEEEKDVLRRGRNTKSGSVPKNVKMVDYRYSTGLETLVGYWYLTGQTERLTEAMTRVIETLEGDVDHGE
ncbi:ribonuclease-3 family protein [Melghirimyces profundicolus]|uniref:Mini-ribonuclease 3 n=1 Tax=Melghirimyces profundicolus TaxID=1242148 RepID=A0A2T6BQ54_9BACL|nr:ribonuclease III domain-containing protein [Melghirimyces profundicolus]PTX58156.1 ribonuclease-3 family protein [Melghirimyces profundicolus]